MIIKNRSAGCRRTVRPVRIEGSIRSYSKLARISHRSCCQDRCRPWSSSLLEEVCGVRPLVTAAMVAVKPTEGRKHYSLGERRRDRREGMSAARESGRAKHFLSWERKEDLNRQPTVLDWLRGD